MRAYEVRKKMMVAKYQWGLFRSELKKQKKKYDNWKANQGWRMEKDGLEYDSYDDLYNDYIIGKIDKKTFFEQRKLYNKIIADNWQRAEKIEWLEKNCEKYRVEYEALEQLYQEEKRREQQVRYDRYENKVNGYRKRYYDPTKNISKYNFPHFKKDGDTN